MPGTPAVILIADDHENIRDGVAKVLKNLGHELLFSANAEETRRVITERQPDLVLLDVEFPDCKDLSLLGWVRKEAPATSVIMLSANTENLERVVEAINLGADDWIPKPFDRQNLVIRVERVLRDHQKKASEAFYLKERQDLHGLDRLLGDSQQMRLARERIRNLAETDVCVLIQGETGTGKELAARALHNLSNRRSLPFVTVNCAAIPDPLVESELFGHAKGSFTGAFKDAKGKFEEAGGGTIFLDEIGDMPLAQQATLLRVLEQGAFCRVGESKERKNAARVLLATNRDLQEMAKQKQFREDLLYRVRVATIQMPALRDRPDDISALATATCKRLVPKLGKAATTIHIDVMKLFLEHDWPGNVRELERTLEGALAAMGKEQREIALRDLPPELLALRDGATGEDGSLPEMERIEKKAIVKALQESGGKLKEAADKLGIHRNTLTRRIAYYGLDKA